MTTLEKRKAAKKAAPKTKALPTEAAKTEKGTFGQMDIGQIDICPRNYRKIFLKSDIEDFAKELKKHGIISSLIVRPMPDGRHELVAGERRYRAAKVAKISTVPVQIRVLTDEEANEIRLAENIHRENPHPLHEAYAVKEMLDARGTIEEVAKRMGKSKTFVYSRIKISELIEPFQEIFLADKLTISEAEAIASLSPQSQQDFFESNCNDWEDEDFSIGNVARKVDLLKCELDKAPFNIGDLTLYPEAGACTHCPFNSATLSYLFPEFGKNATCSNSGCFATKCSLHTSRKFLEAFHAQRPEAIIYNHYLDEELEAIIEAHSEIAALPSYDRYSVRLVTAPIQPDPADYEDESEDGQPLYDEAGYNLALQEYQEDLEAYQAKIGSGEVIRGLYVENENYPIQLFQLYRESEAQDDHLTKEKVTAKQVQEAIKAGTATAELLQAEIDRINDREKRAKEIDLDKIQKRVHEKFNEQTQSYPDLKSTITAADQVALRLIVFQALDWQVKRYVEDQLLVGIDMYRDKEAAYKALEDLSEEQFCFLIRAVLVGNSQSQYPGNLCGYTLYQCAEASGIDVLGICNQQAEIAGIREEKASDKIKDIEQRIKKLSPAS